MKSHCDTFSYDKNIVIEELEIISFLENGESSISGKALRERARELGANFGLKQAEYLLDNQEKIHKEWRKYLLVFPGFIKRGLRGSFEVSCLCWYG